MYHFLINPRAFKAILAGTKKIEVRVSTDMEPFDYCSLVPGDILCFENTETGEVLSASLVSAKHYTDSEELLENEDCKSCTGMGERE